MALAKYQVWLSEQILRQLAKDHGLDLFFTEETPGTRIMNIANNTDVHHEFLGQEIKPGVVYQLPIQTDQAGRLYIPEGDSS